MQSSNKAKVGQTQIHLPGRPKKKDTPYEKSKKRKRFRKRAGIEPVIGHLKSDHRMKVNFLKGFKGDEVNAFMAAAAFNLKKWLNASFWGLLSGWFIGLIKQDSIKSEQNLLNAL